jgi:hypothetical protein
MTEIRNWKKWRKNQPARSESARRAVNMRWDRVRAEKAATALPEKPIPDPLRRITLEDFMTGVSHVITFHWIGKNRSFRIEVDGKFWRIGGWSASLALTRKACVRISRHE